MYESLAYEDFERAYQRSWWRKLIARLTGRSNELLPFDEVRDALPYRSQRDIGLQVVPLNKIVGSVGRYRDFDRAFLPIQRQTSERWVNIRKAHYRDVALPPVDLYKIGDVYFVKDGNHRVSVARDRNQTDIDAYVTEIDIPFRLTPDMDIDSVNQEKAHAQFRQDTRLDELRPDADLRLSNPAEYDRLREHIAAHHYYLGTERQSDVSDAEAVESWYDSVYRPLVDAIEAQGLRRQFPDMTAADLYLRVSEYQWLVREAAQDAIGGDEARDEATERMADIYTQRVVRRVIRTLRGANWIDTMIRDKEHSAFLDKTGLLNVRPEARVLASLPGKYEKILHHIDVHHYYLGLEQQRDVPYDEAVASWYDNVYLPTVEDVREQKLLEEFPGRTETDAYIWLVEHRDLLEASSG
ncbi:MAG: hypothetical protein KA170_06815 [Candidatus Promineofilum sp.]|nr:hypothetical protein [Promineifilum sp.]